MTAQLRRAFAALARADSAYDTALWIRHPERMERQRLAYHRAFARMLTAWDASMVVRR